MIHLLSIFRNAETYVPRFVRQVDALIQMAEQHGINLSVIFVEGDSTDNTVDTLRDTVFSSGLGGVMALEQDFGNRWLPGHDTPERWAGIAHAGNIALDQHRQWYLQKDARKHTVVYVESDLLWTPGTLFDLCMTAQVFGAVAPMCFWEENGKFYDTWGHRKDGVRFTAEPPYHPAIPPNGLTAVDSAGSCIAMRGDVALGVRFSPENGIIGLCESIRAQGVELWLDTGKSVTHPSPNRRS